MLRWGPVKGFREARKEGGLVSENSCLKGPLLDAGRRRPGADGQGSVQVTPRASGLMTGVSFQKSADSLGHGSCQWTHPGDICGFGAQGT